MNDPNIRHLAHPSTPRNVRHYVAADPVTGNKTRWAVTWAFAERFVNLTRTSAGTVSVTALAPGNLTSLTLAVANGSCSAPSCPASGQLARNAPMVCNFTCSPGITAVTPTAAIDGGAANITGAPKAPTLASAKGASACVKITAP